MSNPKVTFVNNPKPFKEILDKKVEQYFSAQNLDSKGNWKLFHKTIVLFVLLFFFYSLLFFIGQVSYVHVGLCILLGLIMASIGFNVMHDAAHDSYSNDKKLNQFITFIGGDFLGGSTFFWKIKHNVIHHTYTNIDGMDDDIAKYPLFRLCKEQEKRWFHKFQFVYSVPLYAITSIYWFFWDDYSKLVSKKINTTQITTLKTKNILFLFLGKIINLVIFVIIPLVYFDFQHFLIGFLITHFTFGLTLALVFQMAHVVEDIEFPVPNEITNKIENEWALHQVKTTANFAMNNKLINWYVGGLNYQIEHHLFPKISHIHYPKLSKIVQETCSEFNIQYHAFPTFGKAIKSHFRLLKSLG